MPHWPAPRIRVSLYLPGIVRDWVNILWLVDTGAMTTCLHPQDAIETLGLDEQLLSRPELWPYRVEHGGMGGAGLLYYRVPAIYGFRHDDGRQQTVQADLFIAQPLDTNRQFPSLLGRNVLEQFRVIVDGPARQVSLA
jgi:hypothetical protein